MGLLPLAFWPVRRVGLDPTTTLTFLFFQVRRMIKEIVARKFSQALLLTALTGLINACGGGVTSATQPVATKTPATTSATAPSSPANEGTPSSQGPYAALTTDGILVKSKNATTAKAMFSLYKALNLNEDLDFALAAGANPLVPGLSLIHLPAGTDPASVLATLNADPTIAYAEPNFIYTATLTPNDPDYGRQWHLNQASDVDIDAPEAWDIQQGSNTVIIASIDTGVDYNHADLRDNIWTNPGEIANNRIDDDRNGYVDDVRGWDFANNDNNPMDDNRHGTHVAGIMAAAGNNGIGGTGVAWRARIIPLKFLSATGSGSSANAIKAIQYAVANGAKISNNSWGGGGFSQALSDAIGAANAAGHLFVAAAGNAGTNNDTTPSYPASYNQPNIISVASTTNTDALSSFSNFGVRTVHVAAPGSSIYSTVLNNSYGILSGTSMAAPVVSGIATLLLAQNPTLTVQQLKTAITSTVDKPPALSTRVSSGGRVNAFRALQSLGAAAPPISTPAAVTVSPATVSVVAGGTQQFTATGGTPPYAWTVANAAMGTITTANGLFTAGAIAGSTSILVRDNVGVQTQASVTVTAATIPAAPTPLALAPVASSISVNQTATLTITGGTPPYIWSTSNPTIASITPNANPSTAVLRGLRAGSVTVSARDSATSPATVASGNIAVAAAATAPAALSVNTPTSLIGVGLPATLSVGGGTPPYTWSSNAPGILTLPVTTGSTVNAVGQATGSGTVTVRDSLGATGISALITVRSVQVQNGASTIQIGQTVNFSATGGRAPYTWSTSQAAIATVLPTTGGLTGVAAGTVTVTATDADGITGASNPVQVVAAVAAAPSAITVTPQTLNMPAGWWVRFSAAGGTGPYSWSATNAAAGTISSVTGWFHASTQVGATTTITATDATGAVANSGTITIVAAPIVAADD